MYPLIEIKSVPIEIRMKTTNASLEYTRGTAEMEISRSDKGLDIKSRPIKLNLDTFEPRTASPAPVTTQGVTQAPQADRQAAYEATSAYSDQGQIMLNARFGQDLVRQTAAAQTAGETRGNEDGELSITPESGLDIEWEDGELDIR